MDPRFSLTLVGLSHRTASVAVREQYVVSQGDVPGCLRALKATEGVCEAFVLSTCNRTEVLVIGERGRDLSSPVRTQVFRNLGAEHLYAYEDVQALIHFYRVASGLDSLVLGESEILGQIKRGMELAQAEKTLGSTLQALLQQALHTGKRVRTETPVGQGTLSVARVGVDVAARVFGPFNSVSTLIVGAGETGILVARHMKGAGAKELSFANRTLARAENAAHEFGGKAWPLDLLSEATRGADLVVACVEASEFAVTPAHFDAKSLKRRDRPMLVVDLSIPRAVDPAVTQLPNVLLYDMDDLGKVVRENKQGRDLAVEGTAEILVSELHKYLAGRAYAAFGPAIATLRQRFETVRDEVLDSIAGAKSDPKDVQLAHELTKRLMDVAMAQMKEGARSTRSEEALDREYQRFLDHLG
ncbi:MAG: glutamyl-tRNA reductase [Planctomycetes bacterium]|nr:glutamyl-tRNA reductase [Planctomycetota bacterium]